MPEVACGFCFLTLLNSSVSCFGCEEKFHLETLCTVVDEKVISVLLDDMVGTVNFCCCEYRMVSGEGRVGAVGDVSAG